MMVDSAKQIRRYKELFKKKLLIFFIKSSGTQLVTKKSVQSCFKDKKASYSSSEKEKKESCTRWLCLVLGTTWMIIGGYQSLRTEWRIRQRLRVKPAKARRQLKVCGSLHCDHRSSGVQFLCSRLPIAKYFGASRQQQQQQVQVWVWETNSSLQYSDIRGCGLGFRAFCHPRTPSVKVFVDHHQSIQQMNEEERQQHH